jgi:hypothetical protein
MMTKSEYVRRYCSQTIIVRKSKKVNEENETREKVPGKPGVSPLLLGTENALAEECTRILFDELPNAGPETSIWEDSQKSKRSVMDIIGLIDAHYRGRGDILKRYAAFTTKRLQAIRGTDESVKGKRKKEVTANEVISCLSKRDDPVRMFANEILTYIGPACAKYFSRKVGYEYQGNYKDVMSDSQAMNKLIGYLLSRVREDAEYKKVLKDSKINREARAKEEAAQRQAASQSTNQYSILREDDGKTEYEILEEKVSRFISRYSLGEGWHSITEDPILDEISITTISNEDFVKLLNSSYEVGNIDLTNAKHRGYIRNLRALFKIVIDYRASHSMA